MCDKIGMKSPHQLLCGRGFKKSSVFLHFQRIRNSIKVTVAKMSQSNTDESENERIDMLSEDRATSGTQESARAMPVPHREPDRTFKKHRFLQRFFRIGPWVNGNRDITCKACGHKQRTNRLGRLFIEFRAFCPHTPFPHLTLSRTHTLSLSLFPLSLSHSLTIQLS